MPYLQYYITAKNKYDIHSPFLYEFLTEVLENNKEYEAYKEVNAIGNKLKRIESAIQVNDLGAGSSLNQSNYRSITDIYSNTAFKGKYGKLLYRVVKHYKPINIIELGTGLGIAASYMAKGNESCKIISVEGDKAIITEANKVFSELGINNVQLINASFDEVLPEILAKVDTVDLALIDGNHQYSSTIKYYNLLADKIKNNTILVFDDIRWSREMHNAWLDIIKDQRISLSLDLYKIGIVFFRKEIHIKQHYAIRF